jgi:hypothetical protein
MLRLLMNAPGFPLRVGVSAEESVLALHPLKLPEPPAAS